MNLHPSWAAKRKLQISGIDDFKGKKTKFDSDGNSFNNSKKTFSEKKNMRNDSANKNLHPSWAAKKDQKKIQISSFQGKKITFD